MSDEVYTNIQYITQREKLTCSAKNNHIRQREKSEMIQDPMQVQDQQGRK